jgi:glycosyltransferase involved in cell wall biosynthesis
VYQHFISTLSFIFRIPLSLDIFKLKYWEKFYWSKATLVATVSEADQKEITKLLPSIKSVIIPNGAGDDMFAKTFPKFNRKNPTLLFVGNFSWLQNIEAAEYLLHHVLPEIRKKIPEVEVVIAGQNSTKKLSTTGLENVKIVALDPDNIDQVKKLYESATLFIAPIFGPGGTRLKILASMASGLPVISTKTGVSGLGVENEKHCLIAQNPQEFITEILKVLDDENLYKSIQKNAFEMVKKEYSWKTIAQKLENVYKGIMH